MTELVSSSKSVIIYVQTMHVSVEHEISETDTKATQNIHMGAL